MLRPEDFRQSQEIWLAQAAGAPDKMALGTALLTICTDWSFAHNQLIKAAQVAAKKYPAEFHSERPKNARRFYNQTQVELIFDMLKSFAEVNETQSNIQQVRNLKRNGIDPLGL
jgi:hypothetical protein